MRAPKNWRRATVLVVCSLALFIVVKWWEQEQMLLPAYMASGIGANARAVQSNKGSVSFASPEWDRLSKAPNVVLALRMDEDDAFLSKEYGAPIGTLPGRKTRPVYDSVIGGIRFDIPPTPPGPSGSASNISGAWFANFGKLFGENQAFRVRWKQRFNRAMVGTLFRDSHGAPQGGIKQAGIGSGDLPAKRFPTCTTPNVVVQTYYQFRFPQLYHACERYWGLYGTPRFAFQNQVPPNGPYCNYDETSAESLKGNKLIPPKACAGWVADVWMDFAIDIANGPYANGRYAWSRARFFVGSEGTPLRLVHDWDSRRDAGSEWGGLGFFAGEYEKGERFGKVWFLPYMTGYSGGHTELAQTWYKELIVTDETESMLKPQSKPATPVPDIPENTVVDLGRYACSTKEGHENCALVTDYSGMVYDRARRRFLVFGGGHASTNYDAINTFSMSRLKWQEDYAPTPLRHMTPKNYDKRRGAWLTGPSAPYPRAVARHTLDEMVIVGDELIVLAIVEGNGMGLNFPSPYTGSELASRARVAHYDMKTKTWSFAEHADGAEGWSAAEFDPVSGKVVLLGGYSLVVYDPQSRTKATAVDFRTYAGLPHLQDEFGKPLSPGALSWNQNLVYYPPNQKMYYMVNDGQVFEVDLDRRNFSKTIVRRISTSGPKPREHTGFAFDARNKLIGGALYDNVFSAFDPRTNQWRSKKVKGGVPERIAFFTIAYSEDDNLYLFLTPERRTWAYRWQ